MDQLEEENKKIIKEKEFLKLEEVNLAGEKKKLNDEAGHIKSDLENIKKDRAVLSAKVDKKILAKYERIVKNKDGLAVVPVAKDSCQGCFTILPPQVINEIKLKNQVVVCENCARILYIAE